MTKGRNKIRRNSYGRKKNNNNNNVTIISTRGIYSYIYILDIYILVIIKKKPTDNIVPWPV